MNYAWLLLELNSNAYLGNIWTIYSIDRKWKLCLPILVEGINTQIEGLLRKST